MMWFDSAGFWFVLCAIKTTSVSLRYVDALSYSSACHKDRMWSFFIMYVAYLVLTVKW